MKDALRKKMMKLRNRLSCGERARASAVIAGKLIRMAEWKHARTVCIYQSFGNEVDTTGLIESSRKQIVYPEHAAGAKIDVFIVPGVAFDRSGNRLGRGGGFYDTLLAGVRVPKIGLAYEIQMIDKVPHTSYDVPMNAVVTERGTYENKTS